MRIKLGKQEEIETDQYELVQLEHVYGQIADKCDEVAEKKQKAKDFERINGYFENPEWFRRLIVTQKMFSKAREALKEEIARRKRKERAAESFEKVMPAIFVRVAKKRLSPELYTEILAEATQKYAEHHQGSRYLFEAEK